MKGNHFEKFQRVSTFLVIETNECHMSVDEGVI